jgi:hypothetical protein
MTDYLALAERLERNANENPLTAERKASELAGAAALREAHEDRGPYVAFDEYAKLLAEVERLRALLPRTVEFQDECRYDHHGYCQAHNLQPKGECWFELVRAELGEKP